MKSYLESLRVPPDSESLIPKEMQNVFAKLAMRKDYEVHFTVVTGVRDWLNLIEK